MFNTSMLADAAPLRCVLIDDDEISRLLLEHYIRLTPNLLLVAAFADSRAALEFLQTSPAVDLLFLDLAMPRLDGWSLLAQLPAAAELPVIIISAIADLLPSPSARPIVAHLVKPLRLAGFREAVAGVRPPGRRAQPLLTTPEGSPDGRGRVGVAVLE